MGDAKWPAREPCSFGKATCQVPAGPRAILTPHHAAGAVARYGFRTVLHTGRDPHLSRSLVQRRFEKHAATGPSSAITPCDHPPEPMAAHPH
ncbi:hypothetical protein C9F11_01850 [Streptomyces sp. YIM 121038]|nr:hypothetical protein C9F11_01850 [Streptomyces sp. YIM 121038]